MATAKVYFRLRTKRGTKPQPIYLVYRFGQNDKLLYPIGLSIAPQYWNDKNSRPRDITENTNKDIIFNRLNELQAKADKYILSEKAAGRIVSKDKLRGYLDSITTPEKVICKSDFLDFVADFAATSTKRINPATGLAITPTTAREYIRLNEILQDFATSTNCNYSFADINSQFYNDFIAFLQSMTNQKCKKDITPDNENTTNKGLSTNTIGKYIQDLKTILNAATAAGVNTNLAYKSRAFRAVTEETENIYLSTEELNRLAALDLSKIPHLDRVRDLFLIGANTGLRFEDFTTIEKGNIKPTANGYNITIKQGKTGKRVIIPANTIFLEIWHKYGECLPPVISHKCFNEYIQNVCKLAGIDTPTAKSITKGGQKIKETAPKYTFVRAHTARRSFATNLYLSGFPAISIMQITGHKTETAFLRYIKVTEEQHAELLRKHWEKLAAENE